MATRALIRGVEIGAWSAVSAAGDTRADLEAATFAPGLSGSFAVPRPAPDERFAGTPISAIPVAAIPRPVIDALPFAAGFSNPVWRAALHVARRVLAEAAPTPAEVSARTGLVVTSTKVHSDAVIDCVEGRGAPEARHVHLHLFARDLARETGIDGPVQAVSVACASGVSAIGRAADLLRRGKCGRAIVVGVDILGRFVVEGFHSLQAVDPAGCRPFDAERAGITPGEAAAAVLLRPVGVAEGGGNTPPAMRVLGFGSSNDANHLTGPSRDGSGLALAIRRALDAARVRPGDIDFIHAHATATLFNDAMEAKAYALVFGGSIPPITGSKGFLGHTFGASGVIETCQCDLIFRRGVIPPVAALKTPAEDAPPSVVTREIRPPRLRLGLKVGAGFGGVNAAIVLGAEER